MKIFNEIEQGGEDWLMLRKGRPTASRFDQILTPTGLYSKQSQGYIRELIAECFCPEFTAWFGNAATERGKEVEPDARAAFAEHSGLQVEQVGFVLSDDGVCGCSPDSVIRDAQGKLLSGLEIKCPSPKVHVGYVLDGTLPDEYKQQVHGSMAITKLNSWHFWSFFPGMKPLHVVVERDEYTEKMEKALKTFVAEYKKAMAIAVPKLKPETK